MRIFYLRTLLVCLLVSTSISAQSLHGIYVDKFSTILGNTVKEDSLLHYAQDSSFNYLALYDLHNVNFTNSSSVTALATFIRKARETYGIQYVGAVSETYSMLLTKITPYNAARTNVNEKFNVFNLEFEFWTTSSVNAGGYYCTQYLQQAGCNCDTAGAFRYYISELHKIDSLANTQGAISETYVGWFNQGQAQTLVNNVDRILLHAYRVDPSSVFGYSKPRLSYLASLNRQVDVLPIFSSEPTFMGPWLNSHANAESYSKYLADFNADNNTWKGYIRLQGYQWFDYGFMPKPVYSGGGQTTPVITASGPLSFCSGGSVTLNAPAGTAYHWSNGATTQSISVTTSGTYSCAVTQSGTTQTSNTLTVQSNTSPVCTFSAGALIGNVVTLTSTSTAGSGSLSSYRWYKNGSSISGATSSTYTVTESADYSLSVTNSNGCSASAGAQSITVPVSYCTLSTPTGLSSVVLSSTCVKVSWNTFPQTDSIIVRYKKDGSNSYSYIRMANTGQTSVVISNLQANTSYSWRVKTMCGISVSSYSSKSYFTTVYNGITTTTSTSRTTLETTYSENDNDELLAYPVPANEFVQLYFFADNEQKGQLLITDLSGRMVRNEATSLVEGDNTINLHTEDLLPGLYFIAVRTDGICLSKRILIQH